MSGSVENSERKYIVTPAFKEFNLVQEKTDVQCYIESHVKQPVSVVSIRKPSYYPCVQRANESEGWGKWKRGLPLQKRK